MKKFQHSVRVLPLGWLFEYRISNKECPTAEVSKATGLNFRLRNSAVYCSTRLPSTSYIRPELMSRAGPEHAEGSSSQAAVHVR
jgi:hypothetical protein